MHSDVGVGTKWLGTCFVSHVMCHIVSASAFCYVSTSYPKVSVMWNCSVSCHVPCVESVVHAMQLR